MSTAAGRMCLVSLYMITAVRLGLSVFQTVNVSVANGIAISRFKKQLRFYFKLFIDLSAFPDYANRQFLLNNFNSGGECYNVKHFSAEQCNLHYNRLTFYKCKNYCISNNFLIKY